MAEDNVYLRRALLDRLKVVGMCPDMRNDLAAVHAVCAQTGSSSAVVAKELAQMRVEVIKEGFARMGVSSFPRPLLASIAATRDVLGEHKDATDFQEALRLRNTMTMQQLAKGMGIFAGEQADRDDGSDEPAITDRERKRLRDEMYGTESPLSCHP